MVTYFYFDSDPSALDGSVLPAPPGKFVLFHSTGAMTSVSSYVQAYNYDLIGRSHAVNTTMSHTNEMYTYVDAADDTHDSSDPRRHDVSCEWSLSTTGILDKVYKGNGNPETQRACLNKGDTVFFLDTGIPDGKYA